MTTTRATQFLYRVLLAVSFVLLPANASAQQVLTSVTEAQMTAMLDAIQIKHAKRGDGLWRVEYTGFAAAIQLGKGGTDMQLSVRFTDVKPTLAKMNEWNSQRRFGKAYVTGDGSAALDLEVDFEGGVTEAYVKNAIGFYGSIVAGYIEFLTKAR